MKKIPFVVIALFVVACIVGCGSQEKAASDVVEEGKKEVSQDAVNFKCIIAEQQTIYFLKGDAKIESQGRESWLIGDKYYMKMDGYLVEYPAEESEMTSEAMIQTYTTSKTVDSFDCEMGVVSASTLELPDLEILTPEEFQSKLMEDMMAEYS